MEQISTLANQPLVNDLLCIQNCSPMSRNHFNSSICHYDMVEAGWNELSDKIKAKNVKKNLEMIRYGTYKSCTFLKWGIWGFI